MNREEVLKQLQSIFRNILKGQRMYRRIIYLKRCRWLGLANPHANYSSNRETFRVRFNFREVIKFKMSAICAVPY